MATQYWLMKSEEEVYSIRELERDGVTCWEGVRNYEARNLMRDKMRVGDEGLRWERRGGATFPVRGPGPSPDPVA